MSYQPLPIGIVLAWLLLGLATLPRGAGWPQRIVAGLLLVGWLYCQLMVHSLVNPFMVAPGFANLWLITLLITAVVCRRSRDLITQQLTVAAACASLVVFGFGIQTPEPLQANPNQGNLLFALGGGVVLYSLVAATVGLYAAAMWRENLGGVQPDAPAATARARKRKTARPAERALTTPRWRAEQRARAFVDTVNPEHIPDSAYGCGCANVILILIVYFPLHKLLGLGKWLVEQIAPPTGAQYYTWGERLGATGLALVLQLGAYGLLRGLVVLVYGG